MSNNQETTGRRQFLATAAAAAAMTLAAPSVLRAQTRTLQFSSMLPPGNLIRENLFEIWAAEIGQITEGRVNVEFTPEALGPPPAHHGLVTSGAADIGYALHGYTPDLFNRARIGQFSFLGDAYSVSQAFSNVYGKLLNAEAEHEGMTLLGLFQHGPGVLMLKDKVIRGPEDYKGLRIRTSGGYIGALMEDLGAVNVPMSPFAVRDAMLDGSIDGVAFPYEGGDAFNVIDVTTFVSTLPGGYYNATWFLGMSNQAAAQLDPADLEIIRRHSAETVHILAAKAFDYADYVGLEKFKAAGTPIEQVSDETLAVIKSKAEAYENSWAEQLSAEGFDGKKALAYTRRITGQG